MAFRDLFVGDDGKLSHTKTWNNVANLLMSLAFAKIMWVATPSDSTSMLFLTYGGIVGASQIASRYLGTKLGIPTTPEIK